jgi:hypothetical protein
MRKVTIVPPRVEFRRAEGSGVAPLNVLAYNDKNERNMYETKVGQNGKTFDLTFNDLMNLIRARCGHEQKRLDFKDER